VKIVVPKELSDRERELYERELLDRISELEARPE